MNGHVRITRVSVQIEAFVDDGDQLVPIPVQPVTYLAGDWPLFDLDHVRQLLQRQVDANDQTPAAQAQPESVHSDG